MARNKSVIEISVIGHKDLIEAQKAVTKYSDALKKAKADVVDHKNATDAEAQSIAHAETNLKKARGEYRQAQRSIKELTNATKTSSSFTMKIAKAFGIAQLAVDGFKKVSQALANQLNDSVKTFADFDIQMQKVKAISGASKEEFDKLKQSAQDLGRSTFFTATQVGELQMNFSKLGFSAAETLDAQSAALDMATATGEDLARTATVIGSSIRGFNLDASEATRVADVMAASFTSSALDLEKFQTSMTKVAPIAELMGVSIEETTAIMGKLSDAGIEASIAGTSLRNIFLKMGDPSSDLAKALGKTIGSGEELVAELKNLRDAGVDVEKMLAVVDQRQVAAFATMVKGVDVIESQIIAFENANGAAAEMAGTVGDSLQGAMLRFQSALDGLKIALVGGSGIGDALKQSIDKLALFFNGIAENQEGLTKIAETLKSIAKLLGLTAAAIVTFNVATKGAATVTALWNAAGVKLNRTIRIMNVLISRNPIGLMVTALTLGIGYLITFTGKTDKLTAAQKKLNTQLAETKSLIMGSKGIKDQMTILGALSESQSKSLKSAVEQQMSQTESLEAQIHAWAANSEEMQGYAKQLQELRREAGRRGVWTVDMKIELDRLQAAAKNLQKAKFGTTFSELSKEGKLLEQQLAKIISHLSGFKKEDSSGKPVVPEEEVTDPVKEELARLEFEMRETMLTHKEMFADREIKTQEDLNKALLDGQLIYLNQMLETTNLTEEHKLAIKERIANAEIALIKQTTKAEKEKVDATKENIDIMKETGSLLMNIGQITGKNSAAAKAGIKISQAAAIADGVYGLINAEVGIAAQAKLPFPSNIVAMASTAAQVASVVVALKQLLGGSGEGSGGQEGGTTSTTSTFARGGLTRGGMFEGASHAHGGVKFAVGGRIHEAEGGEAIINKRSTAAFRPILSAINSYNGNGVKFADGGLISSGEKFAMGGQLRSVQQIVSGGMGSAKVVMVESDVTTTQGRVSALEAQASF